MTKRRSRSPKGTSRRTAPPASPASASGGPAQKKGWGAAPVLAIGLLLAGSGVFLFAALGDETTQAAVPEQVGSAEANAKPFPYFDSAEEARPFPVTMPPSTYTNETLRTAYAIAKEIPEVLVQLPCLCGCHGVQEDHGSLLDCYVDNHAAT